MLFVSWKPGFALEDWRKLPDNIAGKQEKIKKYTKKYVKTKIWNASCY